jgi:hypothetical protein
MHDVNGSTCLEARHAERHVQLRIFLGTPSTAYSILFRLGSLLNCSEKVSLVMYKSEVLHSRTVKCHAPQGAFLGPECADLLVAHAWSETDVRANRIVPVGFSFGNQQTQMQNDNAESLLGLDGELSMCAGTTYELTQRSLCMHTPVEAIAATVSRPNEAKEVLCALARATTADSQLFTQQSELVRTQGLLADTPAARECVGNTSVRLFPDQAMRSDLFTGQTTSTTADMSLSITDVAVEEYYQAVEMGQFGVDCGLNYDAMRILFSRSCNNHPSCQLESASLPSVPFSRLENKCILLRSASADKLQTCVGTYTPLSFTSAMNPSLRSWLQLFSVLLAAGVMFTRMEDVTYKPDELFFNCLQMHTSLGKEVDATASVTSKTYLQSTIVGTVAVLSRFCMALAVYAEFYYDGLGRVATSEVVASVSSLVHLILLATNTDAR